MFWRTLTINRWCPVDMLDNVNVKQSLAITSQQPQSHRTDFTFQRTFYREARAKRAGRCFHLPINNTNIVWLLQWLWNNILVDSNTAIQFFFLFWKCIFEFILKSFHVINYSINNNKLFYLMHILTDIVHSPFWFYATYLFPNLLNWCITKSMNPVVHRGSIGDGPHTKHKQ